MFIDGGSASFKPLVRKQPGEEQPDPQSVFKKKKLVLEESGEPKPGWPDLDKSIRLNELEERVKRLEELILHNNKTG